MSLVAAILTGIHTGFNCDTYQGEARRLSKALQSLVANYQYVQTVDQSQLEIQFNELETRLKDLRHSSDIRVARWCTRQAKREVDLEQKP